MADIATSLDVAIAISSALAAMHERGVLHGRLTTAQIRIEGDVISLDTAEGDASLAYLAPEQTGRMNRGVDARADLYALGVVLYEMLAGRLPFVASTASEWVHRHVARRPPPLGPAIPEGLAAIALKLLAKSPEDRYQTAASLHADLERAREIWRRDGDVPRFALADREGRRFSIDRAYGREAALKALRAALGRVAKAGVPELALLSGSSGIGKTALVAELERSSLAGLFCTGKYDQFTRDLPYATLASALGDLSRQLVRLPAEDLEPWRHALREAAGSYAKLAIDVAPPLALLLGHDHRDAEVPAMESKARVHQTLAAILSALGKMSETLTLFIDDLQWADPATLDFLRYFFEHDQVRHVLVVGAYRESELAAHPALVRTLEAIRELGPVISEVKLGPLEPEAYAEMLAAMLQAERAAVVDLAAIVHAKTGGNPFFAIHFTSMLAEDGLLSFDSAARAWRWDLARIESRALTDNVVDLLIATLQRLPEPVQAAAFALACLGTSGTMDLLAELLGTAERDLEHTLAPAARLGLIVRTPDTYRFAHDRVQEAAHRLASPMVREQLHLSVARLLQKRLADRDRAETAFELASHYQDAGALVVDPGERILAAEANLVAAERARSAGAYASATAYIVQARDFLGEEAWERAPALTARIELVHAQCDHLEARLELAGARLEMLAARATDLVVLAEVARLRGEVLFARGRVGEALEACVRFLRQVGFDWPTTADVSAEYETFLTRLEGRSVQSLASLPEITDPLHLACSNVLLAMVSPAGVIADRSILAMTLFRMVSFACEHGLSSSAALAFARIPEILIQHFDDWERGLEFGRLVDSIIERDLFLPQRGRVFVTCTVTADPYLGPPSAARLRAGRARQLTHAAGDVTYHNIALITELLYGIAAGEPLARLVREGRESLAVIDRSAFAMMKLSIRAELRFVEQLAGEAVTDFDAAAMELPGNRLGALNLRARDMLAAMFLGDDDAVIAAIDVVEPLVALGPMRVQAQDFHFAAALSRMARADLEGARRHVERFLTWGAHYRQSYGARMQLLEAEVARLEGRFEAAARLYDAAVTTARARGVLSDEALASERAERFYETRDNPLAARAHRENALSAWRKWGAFGKLRRVNPGSALASAVRPDVVRGLGMARVATMAQTVTSETDLDRLASKVLTLALAEGGAVRGRLVLASGNGFLGVATIENGKVRSDRAPYAPTDLVRRATLSYALVSDEGKLEIALPFVNQGRLVGLLLLESTRPFTSPRLAVLSTLAGLSAIALEHARLFADVRAAEAHRAEAERLSRTGSFGWDLERGECTWSEEALAIFGYPPDTLATPERFVARAHPSDRERIERELADVRQRARLWTTEYRVARPNGEERTVQVHARSVASGEDVVEVSGAIVDVTEAKRLGNELDASRRYYGVLLSSIEDGVVVADDAERITFMNRAAEKLTGFPEREAIGQPYGRVVTIEQGALVSREGRTVPVDEQRSALVDDAGAERGSVRVIRDATEQRAAARAEGLALMNERFELAFRGSNVGMWLVPLVDGKIPAGTWLPVSSVNVWEFLGWKDPIVDHLQVSHPERIHADDRGKLFAALEANLRGETSAIDVQARFLHANGDWRSLLVRGRVARDEEGRPVHAIGTAIDITEELALESDIRRARDAAEAANRAKDDFLANVSHEVRTPMNAIIGMTELALSTNLTSEQRPWLTTVKSSADNLLVIIDELLDYSKAEANKLELSSEPLSIRELVGEVLSALAMRGHRKGLELLCDVANDVPERVIGDKARLRQILVNLVGNAIKFTNVGEVVVSVRSVSRKEIAIGVADTGIGIAKEKQSAVFEAFTQEDTSTTRRFGGTGLGLTIAARLATLMGGRIELESEPGKGSTFSAHVKLAHAEDARGVRAFERPARVLIRDESASQRALLERWCRDLGLQPISNAAEADVVLLDSRLAHEAPRFSAPIVALGRAGVSYEHAWATARLEKPLLAPVVEQALRAILEPSEAPLLAGSIVESAPVEPARRSLRVLVGEDNVFNSDLVRELLTRRGHEVVIAEDGHATLARALEGSFDLLLLDLHMPGIDGFRVVRELRHHEQRTGAHLPVVALTARSRREDREACLAAGMDDFLSKPLQSKRMFELIEQLTGMLG